MVLGAETKQSLIPSTQSNVDDHWLSGLPDGSRAISLIMINTDGHLHGHRLVKMTCILVQRQSCLLDNLARVPFPGLCVSILVVSGDDPAAPGID